MIFKFFGQNSLKLELGFFCPTQNTYKTLRETYQVNFRRENKPLSEF